jgi:poly(A) polymerase
VLAEWTARPDGAAALRIVRRLRSAGFEAAFVGGCVRDLLLGRAPKEFDVATSATPDEVEGLFRRTIEVGKAFGVVRVREEVEGVATETEVATFRADVAYVDGRRPQEVRFTTAREDAERRDFTVNGLFLDPETGEITDYVGGRGDLDARILRAIGDPQRRFEEDKLRILRAIRFAATGPFEIERATWDAVCRMAGEIRVVSWERIREELSRILVSGRAAHGFRLLHESGVLDVILPEIRALEGVEQPPEFHPEGDVWVHTLLALEEMDRTPPHDLVLALGVLFHDVGKPPTFTQADPADPASRIRFDGHARVGSLMTADILRRLKFSNDVIAAVTGLVDRHMAFVDIRRWREAKVRRFLTGEDAERHLALHRIDCLACHRRLDSWEWSSARRAGYLAEPPLPPRLVSGDDLLAAGWAPGPELGKVLAMIDDERLEGRLTTKAEAIAWATGAARGTTGSTDDSPAGPAGGSPPHGGAPGDCC